MATLADYTHLVSEIEEGRYPPGFTGEEAIDKLIVEICVAPWKTPDERSQAQELAARLANIKEQPRTAEGGGGQRGAASELPAPPCAAVACYMALAARQG